MALTQLSTITVRLRELAQQASNGTYGFQQRQAIDIEAQELSKEYFRIARSTTFNDQGIFFAEFGELRLQAGFGVDGGVAAGLGGAIGTGNFQGAAFYDTEAMISDDVVLGDLNGDGVTDLVSVGYDLSNVGWATVRLGAGDGTFGAAQSFAAEASGARAVALGDLNGDGILDLVTAGSGGSDGRATVRLGNGDGSFGVAVSYAMESSVSVAVTLGDVNGDGVLDLITGGLGGGGGRATVRLGTGNGSFGAATSYSMESVSSFAVSVADVNGDGVLDLLTAGLNGGSGGATVRLGSGDGTFATAVSYTAESFSIAIAVGDLNGDGLLDLVTAGASGIGLATVRLNLGNGTFGAATSYATESGNSNAVRLGDVNGDGRLDLITAGDTAGGGFATVHLGVGDGTFQAAASYQMDTALSRGLALGDLNGDDVIDLVSAGSDTGGSGSASVRMARTADGISPLLPFSLTTRAGALQALSLFDRAATGIATQRGIVGAFQSRLAVATRTLQASAEGYAAAAGRITDADVAAESARLVSKRISEEAAAAVLAQVNQQPAMALTLLT